jgi:hypothetical protein
MAQKRLFLKFNDNGGIINTDIKQPNVRLSYTVSRKQNVTEKTKMFLPERQPGRVIINFVVMCMLSNPSQLLSPIKQAVG